ncbi:hypothetical protein CFIMG_008629RA00001 [Ceratocystis fimbriata CBS 114723]|uniref:Uncharacterized protein n=1 Tax=Ceratocystis fimbriata CBS 114723 TaxID=1035309 RepID=A0A2C5XHI1_9PEZI|nr:hypothetical protein CFIMG_008629RA00001 [Ceratocystis fimbriata CBS 114723]
MQIEQEGIEMSCRPSREREAADDRRRNGVSESEDMLMLDSRLLVPKVRICEDKDVEVDVDIYLYNPISNLCFVKLLMVITLTLKYMSNR